MVGSDERSAHIQICVSDTGIGIAPEKQKGIFERFQQAETETTRRYGGTGLGLAIVKQLVDMQDGTIRLKSELNKGSEFMVDLTYKLPDLEQLFSEAMAAETEQVSLQKIKALIAEDNLMNQQLIAHLMKSWSIDFTIVSNGAEAVREVTKTGYAIVLMDIQMPEMDGYTATSIIRNELKDDIPIIAMTAHAMSGEREKCLEIGMNDYVSKPIKETVLYNMIARHAQRNGQADSPVNHHVINLNYLHQLSGNDSEFENQILTQFLVQLPEELSKLEDAIQANDFETTRRVAHSMKSTVGYVGLSEELHPVLNRIERNAENETKEDMPNDFNLVREKCEAAVFQIRQMLHGA